MTNVGTNVLYNQIKPHVQAMQKAAGLSEFDALTSVLYAITTFSEELTVYPILIYLGVAGGGKSSAMKQLSPMCKGSKWIEGKTLAAQRKELIGVRTAFVEEADGIDTDLYTCRYSEQTGKISVNKPLGQGRWELTTDNIFGSTVMHRRASIADVGLRSRSIVIRTKYKEGGDYEITQVGDLSVVASQISMEGITERNRIWQTWRPLISVARDLRMSDWIVEAWECIEKETRNLRGGQGYEPSEAVLQAIDIKSRGPLGGRQDKTIKMLEIRQTIKDVFALSLNDNQIREEAEARGFTHTRVHNGYPAIKVTKKILDELLPE